MANLETPADSEGISFRCRECVLPVGVTACALPVVQEPAACQGPETLRVVERLGYPMGTVSSASDGYHCPTYQEPIGGTLVFK